MWKDLSPISDITPPPAKKKNNNKQNNKQFFINVIKILIFWNVKFLNQSFLEHQTLLSCFKFCITATVNLKFTWHYRSWCEISTKFHGQLYLSWVSKYISHEIHMIGTNYIVKSNLDILYTTTNVCMQNIKTTMFGKDIQRKPIKNIIQIKICKLLTIC